jgi:hypothetical protein
VRYIIVKDNETDLGLLQKILTDRGVIFTYCDLDSKKILEDIREYKSCKVIIVYDLNIREKINKVVTALRSGRFSYSFINSVSLNNEPVITRIIDRVLSDKRSSSKLHDNLHFPDDRSKFLHGVEKHYGNLVGNVPLIFSRHGHNMWFDGMFRGRSAFLVLGGPSLLRVDYKRLSCPGVLTLGVNNSVRTVRPTLWTSVDDPANFVKSVWLDPKIMKFVPITHSEKTIFDNVSWKMTDILVGECPNVWFYKRNERFNAKQFLFEDTFNWGDHSELGGARSVMLVAIRLLFYLGVRTVYLVGCDFNMSDSVKYHFSQDRSDGSIRNNNRTYEVLIKRFMALKPIFVKNKFNIFNCSPGSALKVFPFLDFDEAIENSVVETDERTEGLYERKAEEMFNNPK